MAGRTVVATDEAVAVLLSQLTINILFSLFHSNVHETVKRHQHTCSNEQRSTQEPCTRAWPVLLLGYDSITYSNLCIQCHWTDERRQISPPRLAATQRVPSLLVRQLQTSSLLLLPKPLRTFQIVFATSRLVHVFIR